VTISAARFQPATSLARKLLGAPGPAGTLISRARAGEAPDGAATLAGYVEHVRVAGRQTAGSGLEMPCAARTASRYSVARRAEGSDPPEKRLEDR